MSKRMYQRQVPVFLVSFLIAVFFIEYFGIENPIMKGLVTEFLGWGSMIALISLSFGYFSLMLMHVQRIRARTRGSEGVSGTLLFKSIVVVASFVLLMLLGLGEGKGQMGEMYMFWFTATVAMAGATWWQEWTHHFYAPFRMFRITTIETATLFLSWLLICLREMGAVVAYIPQFEAIGDWIMKVPYMASNRGAMIAAGIGVVVLAIRALVGREPGLIEMEMA